MTPEEETMMRLLEADRDNLKRQVHALHSSLGSLLEYFGGGVAGNMMEQLQRLMMMRDMSPANDIIELSRLARRIREPSVPDNPPQQPREEGDDAHA